MTPLMPTISPQEFIAKWENTQFSEAQGAQSFFDDLCRLVGHQTPTELNDSQIFACEKQVPGGGEADAYFEDHFVWEFKSQTNQLAAALQQAIGYARHLKNPPLIIVSSFQTIRIETNFQGMELVRYDIQLQELVDPQKLQILKAVFFNPAELRPTRRIDDVTRKTAGLFADIVADMEGTSEDPERLARYLNQIVFCLYAEDAGLLPGNVFTEITEAHHKNPKAFDGALRALFSEMANGGFSGSVEIPHFNGDLFKTLDTVELTTNALERLSIAAKENWRSIEPSIFGTLFEGALDASKRAQTGAHYTSAGDIELVVEPVVMTPLSREWETAMQEIDEFLDGGDAESARVRLETFRERLASVKVLDPACGSGNFLYIALRSLLKLEREVIDFAAVKGWVGLTPIVQPNQMLGLEIDHYAAELARTALWIGYVQWHQGNGFPYTQRPILTPLDTIQQTDAILDLTDPDNPVEPEWPAAEFIVGNPPFLGHVPFRESLGGEYVVKLYALYSDQIPNSSDLCCYWFEKARAQIAAGATKRAGLLATQAIRFQSNRLVLTRIKETGEIFSAIPDQPWVLNGATVHTAIICFDDGTEAVRELNGVRVKRINADLTAGPDLTRAMRLKANRNLAFQGIGKVGDFDIPDAVARTMFQQHNPHGRPNTEVIKRWINGTDIAQRQRNVWAIDFGVDMPENAAAMYVAPFEYVKQHVKPTRIENKTPWRAEHWWLHGYPAKTMRQVLAPLQRYIATPKVSKHRFFVWLDGDALASNLVVAIARDDDYCFGVLSSRIHELWSRHVGSQLREAESGGTYTPTTCFETFPFPCPTEEQREAVSRAAADLDQLREKQLNPPGASASELEKSTLTNLYNNRDTWLANLHDRLDEAVADAYGWPADLSDEEILEGLLALNLERAAAQ